MKYRIIKVKNKFKSFPRKTSEFSPNNGDRFCVTLQLSDIYMDNDKNRVLDIYLSDNLRNRLYDQIVDTLEKPQLDEI